MPTPEELTREKIDKILTDCGWTIQSRNTINLSADRGVAIRENQSLIPQRRDQQFVTPDDGRKFTELAA